MKAKKLKKQEGKFSIEKETLTIGQAYGFPCKDGDYVTVSVDANGVTHIERTGIKNNA